MPFAAGWAVDGRPPRSGSKCKPRCSLKPNRGSVWVAEQAPEDFAFELEAGTLCCNVGGQRKTPKALDELCAATAMVAGRLTDEAGARQG
jgi:hypothetical protein